MWKSWFYKGNGIYWISQRNKQPPPLFREVQNRQGGAVWYEWYGTQKIIDYLPAGSVCVGFVDLKDPKYLEDTKDQNEL